MTDGDVRLIEEEYDDKSGGLGRIWCRVREMVLGPELESLGCVIGPRKFRFQVKSLLTGV